MLGLGPIKYWGVLEWIIAILLVGLGGLIIWMIYTVIDNKIAHKTTIEGTIHSHWYTTPYTTFVMSGKVLVPISHPARCGIWVEYENKYHRGTISCHRKNQYPIGSTVSMEVKTRDLK